MESNHAQQEKMSKATLDISAHRGSLWITPVSLTGFLKPHLQYFRKYTPNEEKSFRNKWGVTETRQVRTNKVRTVKENLYSEQDEYLVAHEGSLNEIMRICGEAGYEVNYSKHDPQFPEPIISPEVVRGLMPDQVECFLALMAAVGTPSEIGGSGAMVQATMGAGKTYVIAALCRAYRKKVVITTKAKAVVRRLHDGMTKLLKEDKISVGMYQGATRIDGDVIVCTMALLGKMDPDDVNVLIFDECHHAAGDKASVDVVSFTRAVKFGLSATITGRFDGKDALLKAILGPIVFELTDQEAEGLGRVVPIKGYALNVGVGPDTSNWRSPVTKERHAIWRNKFRNDLVYRAAMAVPEDQQLVIFVATREHGNVLKQEFFPDVPFYHGDLKDSEQKPLLEAFESGELKRLIATDSIGEGVDPKNLMVVIDTNWKSSKTQVPQRAGRNRRHGKDKPWGILITFRDNFDDLARKKSDDRLREYKRRGYSMTNIIDPSEIEFAPSRVIDVETDENNGPGSQENNGGAT